MAATVKGEPASPGPQGETEKPAGAAAPPVASVRYIARQPILDLNGRVYGYELLFRNGMVGGFSGEGNHATRLMIDNTVLFGLKRLTGSLPAFVNCTAEALMSDQVLALPSSMTVLEVLESIKPSADLVHACRRLKADGYRIALDDFSYASAFDPLLRIADYVKIDFRAHGPEARARVVAQLSNFRGALVAEKVETEQECEQARGEGFTLFQGYYFCQPVVMERRKVPANSAIHLRLLKILNKQPLDVRSIGELVKREASLTWRLLRLVNSPMFALHQEVISIETALIAVGDDTFRRMAVLAIASEFNAGRPDEVLRMGFVRARFCELTAGLCGLDATEQYLLGLFSMLPAMLRVPMVDAVVDLPLRDEARAALLGTANPERCPLGWIEVHERGDWEACDRLAMTNGLDAEQLHQNATEALVWADEVLASR